MKAILITSVVVGAALMSSGCNVGAAPPRVFSETEARETLERYARGEADICADQGREFRAALRSYSAARAERGATWPSDSELRNPNGIAGFSMTMVSTGFATPDDYGGALAETSRQATASREARRAERGETPVRRQQEVPPAHLRNMQACRMLIANVRLETELAMPAIHLRSQMMRAQERGDVRRVQELSERLEREHARTSERRREAYREMHPPTPDGQGFPLN